jgi:phage-related protein
MTAEELQNAIQALKNSIELFTAQLEAVALGIPKKPASNAAVDSVIPVDQQAENNEIANKRNGDVGPSDIKFIDELHKKFKPLFDELKPKTSNSIDAEASDVEDVLSDEGAQKTTNVSIVSISEGALESIKDALKPKNEAQDGKGGGFLSGILGLLGGAGATAIGGGLFAMLVALPKAIPGILVALGAIIGAALAFSAAAVIVVKTLSYLKDDIVGLFPVIDKFAKIFTEFAVAVIPVIGKALTEFTTTVLPVLMGALTAFASVVLPVVIKAIAELISSPGFKFLVGEFVTLVSQSVKMLGELLIGTFAFVKSVVTDIKDALVSLFENTKSIIVSVVTGIKEMFTALLEPINLLGELLIETTALVKSVVSDTKDALISMFENAKAIIIPVVADIKEVFIALIEPIERTLKSLFDNIKATLIPISNDVKDAFIEIGKQVQNTVLGAFEKIDALFSKIPDIIGSVFDKIAEFSNKVSTGKIGTVARELGSLAASLLKFTGSSLLNGLAQFFTKNPFEKIIEFQNNLDVSKLSVLSTLAPALQKLMDVNVDQLKGVSTILDDLISKSIEVSKTVEGIFKGTWYGGGGVFKLIDILKDAKQGAEGTITSMITKASDAQIKVAELQLSETKITNKILSDIFRKMDALNMNASSAPKAARPGTIAVDESLPLQFTSTNTRQQILQSGNSK